MRVSGTGVSVFLAGAGTAVLAGVGAGAVVLAGVAVFAGAVVVLAGDFDAIFD